MADKQLREFAPPLAEVKAGQTLIRSMPTLGYQRVRRRARDWCDEDMPDARRKEYFRPRWERYVRWREGLGETLVQKTLRIDGPHPHFNQRENWTQYGDDGDSRPMGNEMLGDLQGSGLVDYYFYAEFIVPERIELYDRQDIEPFLGQKGIRAFRDRDFAKDNWTVPTNDN